MSQQQHKYLIWIKGNNFIVMYIFDQKSTPDYTAGGMKNLYSFVDFWTNTELLIIKGQSIIAIFQTFVSKQNKWKLMFGHKMPV